MFFPKRLHKTNLKLFDIYLSDKRKTKLSDSKLSKITIVICKD